MLGGIHFQNTYKCGSWLLIPEIKSLRQEDHEFKVLLGYLWRPCLTTNKKILIVFLTMLAGLSEGSPIVPFARAKMTHKLVISHLGSLVFLPIFCVL